MSLFNDTEFDENVLKTSLSLIGVDELGCSSSGKKNIIEKERDPYQPIDEEESTDLTITKVTPAKRTVPMIFSKRIPNDEIDVKKEAVDLVVKKQSKNVKFSLDEDKYLKAGLKKYGRKAWALILKDSKLKFHSSRTRDSLRMRADSSAFKKFSDS